MAFTTWVALLTELNNCIADAVTEKEVRLISISTPDGTSKTFRNLDSLLNYRLRVKSLADEELDTTGKKRFGPMQIRFSTLK